MRIKIGIIAAALLLAGGAVGCNKPGSPDPAASPAAVKEEKVATVVEVVNSEMGDMEATASLTGHLRAISKAQINTRVAGRVAKVNYREGDHVAKGDVLIELENSNLHAAERQAAANLAAAQARLEQARAGVGLTDVQSELEIQRVKQAVFQAEAAVSSAKAQHDDAVINLNRQRDLFSKDAVSKYAVEQAELKEQVTREQLGSARSAEQAAREAVRIAEENRRQVGIKESDVEAAAAAVQQATAALEAIRVDLRDSVLRAPISGTIISRNVEPGQSLGATGGSALMMIVDNSVLEMIASLDERYRANVTPGRELEVSTNLGDPVKAKVVDIIPSSDPSSHTIKVRLKIPNENGLLVEGAYATATLPLNRISGVKLPRNAVNTSAEGTFVIIYDGGTAKKQMVDILCRNEDFAVVKGMNAGPEVVTSGGLTIVDGQPLKIAEKE